MTAIPWIDQAQYPLPIPLWASAPSRPEKTIPNKKPHHAGSGLVKQTFIFCVKHYSIVLAGCAQCLSVKNAPE